MVNRTGGCQQKLLLRSDHQYRKDVQIVFENETFINNHRLPRNGEYLCRQLVPHLLLHPPRYLSTQYGVNNNSPTKHGDDIRLGHKIIKIRLDKRYTGQNRCFRQAAAAAAADKFIGVMSKQITPK